jgi:glycosyltransferase involved in cell wall biosynthesis
MPEELKVSIVLPAHNEERAIGTVLQQLQAGNYHEVLVVDDGSQDKTAEIAAQYATRVIRHPHNIGNGGAVKTGIRNATGNIIVLMDADGQHPPAEVPRLLEKIEDSDMVVGARTRESISRVHRNIANRIFNRYASYVVDYDVPDLTSGFRVIRAQPAKQFVHLLPNTFSYPTTITIIMFRSGYRVHYEPFAAPQREGESKIKPIRDGLRFLLTITRLAVLFVPLKVFLPVSMALLTTGMIYAGLQLLLVGRFSNMPALLLTSALLVFLNGLIAEQIAMQGLRDFVTKD